MLNLESSFLVYIRDVGSISNLGGTTLQGHFFLKKKGAFSTNKKGTSLFVAKSWGAHAPSAPPPVPTSMVYILSTLVKKKILEQDLSELE